MALIRRKRQLAAKVESTKGTAETLSASDAGILVEDLTCEPDFTFAERNPLRSDLSTMPSMAARKVATVTCRVEVKGSGTADTPPSWGVLLKGCGFRETINSGTSVVYEPDSDDDDTDTLTLGFYNDGRAVVVYGARGNVSLECTANGVCYFVFTFTGIYQDTTDTAMLSGITYESTLPPQFRSANLTLNFGSAWSSGVFSSLTLDMANEVVLRDNANASNGLSYAMITGRDPGGTIDFDSPLVADQDFYGLMEDSETGSLAFDIGSESGNHISFSAPAFQIIDIGDGDRDGISVDNITYKLRRNSGDDELTITHQ